MQHVSSFTTVPAAARKSAALLAYDAACGSPAAADWRSVADLLRAAVSSPARSESSAPRWFADWKLGKVYSLDTVSVRFADGELIRCNIAKAPGKLPRIAAACRVAIGFYRARTRRHDVPAFAYIEDTATGATFDAEACSGLTADIRRADHADAAVQARASVEAVDRMAREVERRRTGLAQAMADDAAQIKGRDRFSSASSDAWAVALAAGEAELAAMREALDVAAEDAGEAMLISAATIKADEINAGAPHPVEEMADRTPVVEILNADPVEEIGSGESAATGSDIPADLTTEAADAHVSTEADDSGTISTPAPTPVDTHPIVAVCTSHRGREKLLATVQDGCFPDHGRRAYHGAYRVTLQDAQEIGEIRGVRFVGLPRKPRTRLVAVVSAPAAIFVPAYACRSLAHLTRGGATLHAASAL